VRACTPNPWQRRRCGHRDASDRFSTPLLSISPTFPSSLVKKLSSIFPGIGSHRPIFSAATTICALSSVCRPAAPSKHLLKAQCADLILLTRHPPHGPKPHRQRRSRILKNCSRRNRNSMATTGALSASGSQRPRSAHPTAGDNETRPAAKFK
jgi:hypothetical protein